MGIPIAARQPVVVEMRLYNPSASAIEAGATIEAELLAPGTAFEPAAAFVAFAIAFSIPAATTNFTVQRSCDAPTRSFFARRARWACA